MIKDGVQPISTSLRASNRALFPLLLLRYSSSCRGVRVQRSAKRFDRHRLFRMRPYSSFCSVRLATFYGRARARVAQRTLPYKRMCVESSLWILSWAFRENKLQKHNNFICQYILHTYRAYTRTHTRPCICMRTRNNISRFARDKLRASASQHVLEICGPRNVAR